MIYLYHGTPGAGKTNYIVEKILEDVKEQNSRPEEERRPIFANIMGLDIDGVEPPHDDFRECPKGSIIYYDEAQEIDHYSSDSRATNPVAKALSVHRSRYGVDIHFITQDPSLLHKYVLKNTGLHTYLWRPANRKSIDVYVWPRAITSPNKTDFNNAYDSFKRSLNPVCFDYYESTPLDTHKKVGSKKKSAVIMTALIFFGMIAFFVYPAISQSMATNKETETSSEELPRAKEASMTLTKTNEQSQTLQDQQQQPQEPEIDYLKLERERVASIAIMGDECIALNPYGHYLDKTLSECLEISQRPLQPSYMPYTDQNNYQRTTYQPNSPDIVTDPTLDLQNGLSDAKSDLNPLN